MVFVLNIMLFYHRAFQYIFAKTLHNFILKFNNSLLSIEWTPVQQSDVCGLMNYTTGNLSTVSFTQYYIPALEVKFNFNLNLLRFLYHGKTFYSFSDNPKRLHVSVVASWLTTTDRFINRYIFLPSFAVCLTVPVLIVCFFNLQIHRCTV